jgi:hypothetical protein
MDTIPRSEPQPPEPRTEARSTAAVRRVKRIPRARLPPSRRRSWTAQASLLVGSAAIAFGVVEAINSWLFSGRALSVSTCAPPGRTLRRSRCSARPERWVRAEAQSRTEPSAWYMGGTMLTELGWKFGLS